MAFIHNTAPKGGGGGGSMPVPMLPKGGGGSGSSAPSGPSMGGGAPQLGGLFAGGMPKLKPAGGVALGRGKLGCSCQCSQHFY
jgi:WAS/WASL-interacting protein